MASLSTAAICFIACHGGPADHFATFAEALRKKDYQVEIYATGPALDKFRELQLTVNSFELKEGSQEAKAIELAQKCAGARVVITDVGDPFDVTVQDTLASRAPNVVRLAYYDNPEAYVPGGYSSTAAKVMRAAQGVLFANQNLSHTPVYETPSKEVSFKDQKRVGIGYYPVDRARRTAEKRAIEGPQFREQLFKDHSAKDQGQKILVYAGANNDVYFESALPAFLRFVDEASKTADLSNVIVLLQQHPRAKKENLDANLVENWLKERHEGKIPQIWISKMRSDEAQLFADAILYYQTTMGPQCVLAGIPTWQVADEPYEDVLVKNGLCSSVTDAAGFLKAFNALEKKGSQEVKTETLYQGLGITPDWATELEKALQ